MKNLYEISVRDREGKEIDYGAFNTKESAYTFADNECLHGLILLFYDGELISNWLKIEL